MAFERVKLALACESKTLASGSKARRPVWATGPSHRAEPANVRGETSMYHIVFQRDGFEVGTLYWNVKFNETLGLARVIGLRCEADVFRIVEVAEGTEVCSADSLWARWDGMNPRKAAYETPGWTPPRTFIRYDAHGYDRDW